MTYYIRHNALPEKRVEFYIAQKVGSIQEEPQQRGLAHFLEHMAFNGTKNFPGDETGKGIVAWCETKGIKFGTNLNAYTSVDETVYNISNVPTDNQQVLDSCLLILHDWSCAIQLKDQEIDKERGVIHEEWRSRDSGVMRLYTEAQPVMYPDSKYSDCMPIGNIEVIDHFPYQAIRDYYAKWYRPDLQGIVIVGDIDVDQMEANIKKTFADVKAPVNPAERIYYPVPDNEEPLIYIGKDKEMDTPCISLFFKHEATPDSLKGSLTYLIQDYAISMATDMLDERLNELRQSANPPFIQADASYNNYFLAMTKDAFMADAYCQAEGVENALKVLLAEIERARRFGFTASEYERARANYLQRLESAYNEREKTKSPSYVMECVNHFLHAEPITGIEYEYATMNQIVPNIPVEAINQLMQQLVTDNNQVVFIGVPDNEKTQCPDKATVEALLKGMKTLELQPYEDKVSNEPLMKEMPKMGTILSEKADALFGATELTLSNGIKVYLKKTDFKADQILMSGFSRGGSSLFANEEILDISQLNSVAGLGGLGNFSKVDLRKVLAGKKVSVTATIGGTSESVQGQCSPKDLETLMQLTYLTFTAPRKDAEAFESYKTRLKAQLESAKANPLSSFNDSIMKVMYGNHPRNFSMQPEWVEKVNYDRIMEMYQERFAEAGDFTFFFVGNIDMESIKPLIAQYIASLPTIGRKENFRDNKMNIAKGEHMKEYAKEQQTPMATNFILYSGKCKYGLKETLLMSMLTQALDIVYTEEVREKEGGTYGVSCIGDISKYPKTEALLQIVYQTDPAKKEQLNKIIDAQVVKMATEGPTAEHMQKIKEYMLKKHKDNQKENSYWLGCMSEWVDKGVDQVNGYEELVNAITVKDVQKFASKLVKQNNKITVVMTVPENKDAE